MMFEQLTETDRPAIDISMNLMIVSEFILFEFIQSNEDNTIIRMRYRISNARNEAYQ